MLSGSEVVVLRLLQSKNPRPQRSVGVLGSQNVPGIRPHMGMQIRCPVMMVHDLTHVYGQLIHLQDDWVP